MFNNFQFKKAKKTKSVAMFFSGGLDSTYLLYKNLKEGHRVTPYYCEILNNVNKSIIEKQRMVMIWSELKKEFNDNNQLQDPRFVNKSELWLSWDSSLRFKQTPIWLLATNYICSNYDEIQIGYVANDDSIPFLNQIKKTYKSMAWMSDETIKRPELTFPIANVPKFEMLQRLPRSLKELIFSCENPNIADEEDLLSDESPLQRYAIRNFISKNKEGKFVLKNFEPCGTCEPCMKILQQDYLYREYVIAQPIFKKLQTMRIMQDYSDLMYLVRNDEQHKTMFHELMEKNNYRNTIEPIEEKWKEVQLVPDYLKANEITGNDVMASEGEYDESTDMMRVEIDKVE